MPSVFSAFARQVVIICRRQRRGLWMLFYMATILISISLLPSLLGTFNTHLLDPSLAMQLDDPRNKSTSIEKPDEQFYLDRIPNVDFWPNVWLPGRARHAYRVLKDPRLTMNDLSSKNWDQPLEVNSDEDPLRIFTEAAMDLDDPKLIDYIRDHVLVPPSQKFYELDDFDEVDHSEHKATSEILLPILKKLGISGSGVFFEAGALDGEIASRTLYLERFHRWRGLVAEMTYPNARRFIRKRRKSWFAPVCVSPEGKPLKKQMRFAYDRGDPWAQRTGTINKKKFDLEDAKVLASQTYVYAMVDCYPLYSLLLAANMTRIDFLALDLEGVELQVLKTLPFSKLEITMVVVEIYHTEEGQRALKVFLASNGFSGVQPPSQELMSQNEKDFYDSHLVFLKNGSK